MDEQIYDSDEESTNSSLTSLSYQENCELNEEDLINASTTIYELAHEYLLFNVLEMHEQKFHDNMTQDIAELLIMDWKECGACDEDDIQDIIQHCTAICQNYFELQIACCPPRVLPKSIILKNNKHMRYTKTLLYLQSLYQPEQRTSEWYEFRHNLLSASSLGKIFGSEASRNRLIYEKCQPMEQSKPYGPVSVTSPLHWGQKYEPLSTMLYEQMFSTKVGEFGCIQHKEIPFIGASPDGIVTKSDCPRFGRMLEIKNIVNREINGNPLKDYWIQMQMQMECCDLDECDFLETKFQEYNEEEDFWKDEEKQHKGVMLYFVERISICQDAPDYGHGSPNRRPRSNTYPCLEENQEENPNQGYMLAQQYSGVPRYEYMPLSIELTRENVEAWIESTRAKLRRSWSLYTTIYWYLDTYSCVLVQRNRLWFERALPFIQNTWETILKERETGCEHRAPASKKEVKTLTLEVVADEKGDKELRNFPVQKGVCLIKLDKEDLE